MSRAFRDDPFLRGNYAPLLIEGEAFDLPIEGELPRELHGTLYRNGPNPQFAPRGRYHWFDGDGMIHAFRLRDGRASYRNRWVRTARFAHERAAGEALFGGIADLASGDLRVAGTPPNAANTNIVWHAGRLLALWEGGPPHALDPVTLETLRPARLLGPARGPDDGASEAGSRERRDVLLRLRLRASLPALPRGRRAGAAAAQPPDRRALGEHGARLRGDEASRDLPDLPRHDPLRERRAHRLADRLGAGARRAHRRDAARRHAAPT